MKKQYNQFMIFVAVIGVLAALVGLFIALVKYGVLAPLVFGTLALLFIYHVVKGLWALAGAILADIEIHKADEERKRKESEEHGWHP